MKFSLAVVASLFFAAQAVALPAELKDAEAANVRILLQPLHSFVVLTVYVSFRLLMAAPMEREPHLCTEHSTHRSPTTSTPPML